MPPDLDLVRKVLVLRLFLHGRHVHIKYEPYLMRPKATCVARSHELSEEKAGKRKNTKNTAKNTMNTRERTQHNPIQFGLLPIARTTIPIESLKERHEVESPRERPIYDLWSHTSERPR